MNYQKYESYETFLLYQEFLSIPDNPFSFQIPEGMMMTTAMIHTFLRAAYNANNTSCPTTNFFSTSFISSKIFSSTFILTPPITLRNTDNI